MGQEVAVFAVLSILFLGFGIYGLQKDDYYSSEISKYRNGIDDLNSRMVAAKTCSEALKVIEDTEKYLSKYGNVPQSIALELDRLEAVLEGDCSNKDLATVKLEYYKNVFKPLYNLNEVPSRVSYLLREDHKWYPLSGIFLALGITFLLIVIVALV
ncbi:hypothetical protein [Pyrococcus kukulkanii]|uniref:Uncharacterized protein n=1 Tax=Pyrococcus kukulkanii TaxID=1609559 RepID=A0ABV4T7M5_9EURY